MKQPEHKSMSDNQVCSEQYAVKGENIRHKSMEGLRKIFTSKFSYIANESDMEDSFITNDTEEQLLDENNYKISPKYSLDDVWNFFLPHLNSRTEEDDFDYVAYEKEKKEVAEAIKNKEVIYISCRDGHALTEEQYYNFRDWVDTVGKPEGSSMESFVKVDLSVDSLNRFVDFVQRNIGYADLRGLSLMAYLDKFLESELNERKPE